MPCGFDGGMPIGVQLVAPWNGEALLLRAGAVYQAATRLHRELPALSPPPMEPKP